MDTGNDLEGASAIAERPDEEEFEEEAEGDDDYDDEGEEAIEDAECEYYLQAVDDPVSLAFDDDGDGDGDEPLQLHSYEQFERTDYEALAARKRKSINCRRSDESKEPRQVDVYGDYFDQIMEQVGSRWHRSRRRKSRELKKRGRRKGSKNKLSPEITKKLGDASLHYAAGKYVEAIHVLKEVVRLAPTLGDSYHMLGLIYNTVGDKSKALNFYILAACLTPKDPYLWKLLTGWAMELGNISLVMSFLSKAISADPKDMSLRSNRAVLYGELGSYQKAAESYEQIIGICPENVEAWKMAAKMYQRCGLIDRAVSILEDYVKEHPTGADLSVIDLLASIHIENKAHTKALQHIELAHVAYCSGGDLPIHLAVKAVICEVHVGNVEKAEILLSTLQFGEADDYADLISKVADSFTSLQHYRLALRYYFMLEDSAKCDKGALHLKIGQCYLSLKERENAIVFLYKALPELEDTVDVRITLASLLLEDEKEDEAIALLSPPENLDVTDTSSVDHKRWWLNGKLNMLLAQIYQGKGMLKEFADAIFSPVRETLFVLTMNRKVRPKKKLPKSVLYERLKVLDGQQDDNVWCGFRPVAAPSELSKAARARKRLAKMATVKEQKKAAALAAGLDWQSDDSDDEPPPRVCKEPPLPNLLKDEKHYQLIIDLCKALTSLQRYWEALEVINQTLKLALNALPLSTEKKEELRSLGAQIAYNMTDPRHGYDYVRYVVQQHPYSFTAWNCYYKAVSRLENRLPKHAKFLHSMRVTHTDCVPPMLISGHQFSMSSLYQAATKEYLEAYKVQPDNALVNLCAGTSLITLAHGVRTQNKHQCIAQGFAFLYNCQRICQNRQESLYNIARAYHQVGLVTLAVMYYEKVLSMCEKDYPIPKLPNENLSFPDDKNPGYCSLHREAAYNLHLIYKKSGALDLARQVLKDYCNP